MYISYNNFFLFFMYIGAYTLSVGMELVRQNCAKYIEKRDGYPSSPSDIYLTSGASEAVKVGTNFVVLFVHLLKNRFQCFTIPCNTNVL